MGKTIGKQAERKFRELMQRAMTINPHKVDGRGSPRFDIHVKVTGDPVDGYYPCITTDFNCATETWNPYTATCWCFDCNEVPLTEGKRYRAINYGAIDGDLIFVVDVHYPEVGCHLQYDSNGELSVDPSGLAGDGLSSPDCDCVYSWNGSAWVLTDSPEDCPGCSACPDPSTIETPGTSPGEELVVQCVCPDLNVNIDPCTLEFNGNQIAVRLDDLAGMHLTTELVPDEEQDDSDSEDGPCSRFAVDLSQVPDCGLVYVPADDEADPPEPSHLAVDVPALVGEGLIVEEGTSGACDKIAFPLEEESTTALGPFLLASGFQFAREGCLIHVKAYTQGITASFNEDGVVIGLVQGPAAPTQTTLGTIDLRDACECCDDSDSGPTYWKCVSGTCTEDPTGPYASLTDCQANCNDTCYCDCHCDTYTVTHPTLGSETLTRVCCCGDCRSDSAAWKSASYFLYNNGNDNSWGLVSPYTLDETGCIADVCPGGGGCNWRYDGPIEEGQCADFYQTTCCGSTFDFPNLTVCCGGDSDSGCGICYFIAVMFEGGLVWSMDADNSTCDCVCSAPITPPTHLGQTAIGDCGTPGWMCVDGECLYRVGGTYATEAECLAACGDDDSDDCECPSCMEAFRNGAIPSLNNLTLSYSGSGGTGSITLHWDSDDYDWGVGGEDFLFGNNVSVANPCVIGMGPWTNLWDFNISNVLIDQAASTDPCSNTVNVTFIVPYSAFSSPPGGATGDVTLTLTGTLCSGMGFAAASTQPGFYVDGDKVIEVK